MDNTAQSPQQQNTPTQPATTKPRRWSWPRLRWPKSKQSQSVTPAQPNDVSIQVFDSVGWVDRRLLWIFEIVSSLAVVLLAAGLVTSQTNVQTHGAILTDNQWMQDAWAWTQNVAIDMSLLGAIIRAAVYWLEKEYKKAVLYGLLALLLLFTAFIVSDVEAMYQSLQGVTIDAAWSKLPLVSIEMLTSIRSFAIVLLLVAHATQYINWYQVRYRERRQAKTSAQPAQTTTIAAQLAQTTIDYEHLAKIVAPLIAQSLMSNVQQPVQRFAQPAQPPVQVNEIKQGTAKPTAIAQHSEMHTEHDVREDSEDETPLAAQATQPMLHIVHAEQSDEQPAQLSTREAVFAYIDKHPEALFNNEMVMAALSLKKDTARRYRGEYRVARGGAQ